MSTVSNDVVFGTKKASQAVLDVIARAQRVQSTMGGSRTLEDNVRSLTIPVFSKDPETISLVSFIEANLVGGEFVVTPGGRFDISQETGLGGIVDFVYYNNGEPVQDSYTVLPTDLETVKVFLERLSLYFGKANEAEVANYRLRNGGWVKALLLTPTIPLGIVDDKLQLFIERLDSMLSAFFSNRYVESEGLKVANGNLPGLGFVVRDGISKALGLAEPISIIACSRLPLRGIRNGQARRQSKPQQVLPPELNDEAVPV